MAHSRNYGARKKGAQEIRNALRACGFSGLLDFYFFGLDSGGTNPFAR